MVWTEMDTITHIHITCTHCDLLFFRLTLLMSVLYDPEHYYYVILELHDRDSGLLHYEYALSSNGVECNSPTFVSPSYVYSCGSNITLHYIAAQPAAQLRCYGSCTIITAKTDHFY